MAERRWVARRSIGRRHTDRKWPRHLRDFWLLCVTVLVALALANLGSTTRQVRVNQRANTRALCAFRQDIQRRYESGRQFLRTHPAGFAGIPAATIRISLQNEASTLRSLSPLIC